MRSYSHLGRLLHVTAYVLKFVKRLRHPQQLISLDLSQAKTLWIKDAQTLLATDEKFPDWKKQLDLFLDASGIWRCGGRISNAEISYSLKDEFHIIKLESCRVSY